MPVRAARRWFLAAVMLAGLVATALWMKGSGGARSERAAPTTSEVPGLPQPEAVPPTAPAAEPVPDPSAEKEWRLEVEIRDENDEPISGRVYLTDRNYDLADVKDTTPDAPAVFDVTGSVNVTAVAHRRDLAPNHAFVAPPPGGSKAISIRLSCGQEITGRVVDWRGDALAPFDAGSLRLWAESVDNPWLRPLSVPCSARPCGEEALMASLGDDSTFQITGLAPGVYRVEVDARIVGSLLPPAEPPIVRAGASDVVLALRRAAEVTVRFVDSDTGLPIDGLTVDWNRETEEGEWLVGGQGSYRRGKLVLHSAPGESFLFYAEVESYESPEPLRVVVDRNGTPQELEMRFRRQADGMAELELLIRDETGNPASPLMVGRRSSSRRHSPLDGRYVLRAPAGNQRIELRSPGDQILLFKREWVPSMHDPDTFPQARAYLPLDVDVELPRGGRVTKEVTVRRAALIWVRQEPTGSFNDVRLLRGDAEVEHALRDLYEDKGLVAAVEPGTYTAVGKAGERVVRIDVEAKPAEVAEVWLRAESAK